MVPVRKAAAVQGAGELLASLAFLGKAALAVGEIRRQCGVGAGQLVDARKKARAAALAGSVSPSCGRGASAIVRRDDGASGASRRRRDLRWGK